MTVFNYQTFLTFEELMLEYGMYMWPMNESSVPFSTHRTAQAPSMDAGDSSTDMTFQDSFSSFNATGCNFGGSHDVTEILDRSVSTTRGYPASRPLFAGDLTISFLYKTGLSFGTGTFPTIVDGRGASGESEIANIFYFVGVSVTTGSVSLLWEYGAGSNESVNSGPSLITTSSEMHIAITRNIATKTVKFYKNGTLFNQGTYVNDPTKTSISSRIAFMSNTNLGGTDFAEGTIANVAVKPGVLEADQINLLYQKQL